MKENLPDRVEKLLVIHTAVTAAAGVSSLALSQAAEAKIVYTPAKMPIAVNGGFVDLTNAAWRMKSCGALAQRGYNLSAWRQQ